MKTYTTISATQSCTKVFDTGEGWRNEIILKGKNMEFGGRETWVQD